jgi:hypothetical protein
MALVNQYWRLSVTWADRGGKTSTYKYRLVATDDGAGDMSDVRTAVNTIIPILEAVSACKIKAYQVEQVWLDTAFTLPNVAQAENEQLAEITGTIRGYPNETARMYIPGPLDLVFQATSGPTADLVNMAQTEVDDFRDLFDSSVTNLISISDGEFWDSNTTSGKRVHRRSSKG